MFTKLELLYIAESGLMMKQVHCIYSYNYIFMHNAGP